MALDENLTAEEQAQLDAMRDSDAQTGSGEAAAGDQAPSPSAGAAEAGEAEKQQQTKMVPHAALHEERERRKEYERQLAEERRARQTLEERTNIILQNIAQQRPPQQASQQGPEIPPIDRDPAGHIVGVLQQLGGTVQQQQQVLQAMAQGMSNQHAEAGLLQTAAAMETQFAAENPDYQKASEFLANSRMRELQMMGLQGKSLMAQLHSERIGVAQMALQQGKNPAAVAYELAKERGYKPPEAPANGAAQPTTEQKLQNVAAGQEQSRSLGNARGGAAAPMTAQRLSEMTDAEFAKAMETPEGRALLGI